MSPAGLQNHRKSWSEGEDGQQRIQVGAEISKLLNDKAKAAKDRQNQFDDQISLHIHKLEIKKVITYWKTEYDQMTAFWMKENDKMSKACMKEIAVLKCSFHNTKDLERKICQLTLEKYHLTNTVRDKQKALVKSMCKLSQKEITIKQSETELTTKYKALAEKQEKEIQEIEDEWYQKASSTEEGIMLLTQQNAEL
ncbi:Hypothetical predicted protein [Scomber scombrus]|uniref:Uncharacterized protein n=1 Tax=Scomber scombrus TaxID=13677 RepID=A0AAV1N623_SCOSC